MPFISMGFSPWSSISFAVSVSPLIFVFTFIKKAHRAGFIIIATNRDEQRVTMRVMGRYFMNSPIIPGQKIIGKKAASVVRVEPITGQATSLVAFMAASTLGTPCCI